MKKEHDVRIDRTKLHPWLDYKLTVLLKKCAKKKIYLIITEGFQDEGTSGRIICTGKNKTRQNRDQLKG